jgi:DNA-binding NarL/FixJ family response regulator
MHVTSKEKEILSYLCRGYSDNEIATKLFVSVTTVKTHVCSLLKKTNSNNRTKLAVYAVENSLYEKNPSDEG